MMPLHLLSAALLLANPASSLNNGLGRTPPLGYSTWNSVGCNVTESHVLDVAKLLRDRGLQRLGFRYVNVDDCWSRETRDGASGRLVPDARAFPGGMKRLADRLHGMGFLMGIYGDRGTMTCQRRPGSKGWELLDADTYAEWGVDFLKQDSCYASPVDHRVAFEEYALMRDALNATGRPIFFSLCGWFPFYASRGRELGNSWRVNADIVSWNGVYASARMMERLYAYSGPGGFNDPDLLLGSNPKGWLHLTPTQSRTQFSLWCVMAAPLLLSSVPDDAFDLETYGNAKAIAINQDVLGFAGRLGANTCPPHLLPSYESFRAVPPSNCMQVWYKTLSHGGVALVFVNWDPQQARDVVCDAECLARVGVQAPLVFEPVYASSLPVEEVHVKTITGGVWVKALGSSASVFVEWRPATAVVAID